MKKLLLVVAAILTFSVLGHAETSTGDIGRYQLYSCRQTISVSDTKDYEVAALFRIDTKTGKTYRNTNGNINGKYVDTWIAIDEFDQKK